MTTKRIAQFQADMATEVLAAARDAHDSMIIAACIRVRQGWLLGKRVAPADLALIAEFA